MKFFYYKDAAGEWRWYIRAANGSDKLADSGEGYKNRQDCLDAIGIIQRDAATAPVIELESRK